MKHILILLFCFPFYVSAQDKPLLIEGTSPNFYLTHIVAPKENYYSIGRLYNTNPKEIAPYNKLDFEKGFNIGQAIKIPLTASNFFQTGNIAADEAAVPLYYVVKEKEGLYRIGLNHNKLPVETLKQWNKITTDAVSNGTKLIVGYLKVKKGQSAFADKAKNDNVIVKTIPEEKKVEEKKVEDKKVEEKKVEDKKDPIIVKPPVVKSTPLDTKESSFKNLFESQTNGKEITKEEGNAGVFKSTSGWSDGKYYCLHNNAAPGTIIKITNAANGKSVYAKVLDVIPDIKQNTGLLIRLSNAASDKLEAGENNFNCILNYSNK